MLQAHVDWCSESSFTALSQSLPSRHCCESEKAESNAPQRTQQHCTKCPTLRREGGPERWEKGRNRWIDYAYFGAFEGPRKGLNWAYGPSTEWPGPTHKTLVLKRADVACNISLADASLIRRSKTTVTITQNTWQSTLAMGGGDPANQSLQTKTEQPPQRIQALRHKSWRINFACSPSRQVYLTSTYRQVRRLRPVRTSTDHVVPLLVVRHVLDVHVPGGVLDALYEVICL
mmetsp:Transcript_3593/g.8337  ORF Transcript_3593/g.8337 Transcript_3593/m.8337 type:complete len:231 (+) Transcript_3593:5-697(+)